MKENKDTVWQKRVAALGFREAAVAFFRDRLRQEHHIEHLEPLIRRAGKHLSRGEIVQNLSHNPTWRDRLERLIRRAPEVTENPEVHFVFHGGGNVPNIPLIVDDRLYVGCGDHFYALDAETGNLIWRRHRPDQTWTNAWLAEESLYVCSGGRLCSLSPDDGTERWRFEARKRLTSPYAVSGKVLVGSEEGTLYALDAADGRRLWTFNVAQAIFVAPGEWRGKIFAASKDHSLYAIDLGDGDCVWRFTTGGKIYAPPYVSGDVIYLTSADHKVYALNAHRGRLLWSFVTAGEVHTSPLEMEGRVYVGSKDRHIYGLAAQDGRELWRYGLFGYPSSPAGAAGMVYVSSQGRVYGFSVPDHRRRWCFPLGFSLATTPVASSRRLYVGTLKGTLICLKFETHLEERGARQVLREFIGKEDETVFQ